MVGREGQGEKDATNMLFSQLLVVAWQQLQLRQLLTSGPSLFGFQHGLMIPNCPLGI